MAIPQQVVPPVGPDLVAVNCTTPDTCVTVRLDSFRLKVVAKGTDSARWRGDIVMSHLNRKFNVHTSMKHVESAHKE